MVSSDSNPALEAVPLADSFFAPAERARREELRRQLTVVSDSPVTDAILASFGGLVAILNLQRQILAVNDAMLARLGVADGGDLLGLRPGEALACDQVAEAPGGCGTGRQCASCGAAVAIVGCSASGLPCERECVLTSGTGESAVELDFLVRAAPLRAAGERFVLLFLKDISREKRNAAVARSFLHDINNVLHSLTWAAEALRLEHDAPGSDLVAAVRRAARHLRAEVALQRILSDGDAGSYQPSIEEVDIADLLDEIHAILLGHPSAHGKTMELTADPGKFRIPTDRSLLLRVVVNLLTNALEATPPAGRVVLTVVPRAGRVLVSVWNDAVIPPEISGRIFHQRFSTKGGPGRGTGTWVIKVFTERYLGGSVAFTSTPATGTTFVVDLPARSPRPSPARGR